MRAILTLLAALLLTAPFAAPPAVAQAPARDWSRIVTVTPAGAFVLGNPGARTRLVEYVSYTCSHCAHFVGEASGPLRAGWIRRGLVALEVRNAIRDPYDLTAAMLARCGGSARFFGDHEALFAHQEPWLKQVEAYDAAKAEGAATTDAAARLATIADRTGLSAFMAKRGLPAARQRACLANKDALAKISAMTKDAWEGQKIGGTPAFAIDGRLLPEVHDWTTLRAALPALPAPPK